MSIMYEFGHIIVPYKVTKYRCTKAFKSAVGVGQGQVKSREGHRVSIRVSVVIRQKFQVRVTSQICNLRFLGFLGFLVFSVFSVFKVLMYAQSHSVHWTQECDQEVGLHY